MEQRVLNGRYQIEAVLGRGGMATVYRARDLKLGRPVAVKVLHGYYANDPQFLRRFEHEAQAAANISAHPNIVDVYDVGQEGDLYYIVMEYVDGETIKDVIDREAPLQVERSLQIVQQAAEGLEAAHRRGLVHRDVKPQNIMVSPDDQVRIADFGIAKGSLTPGLTDPGTTFGTAEYISPEQAQGQPATPQSDIYALGVVLYEMLTGRLPFMGDSPVALAMQHVQAEPIPPRRLNPQIPPQLENIIMRCLSKNPAARPASARALAQELRSYRERGEQTTLAGMTPAPPRAGGQVVRPMPQPPRQPPLTQQRQRQAPQQDQPTRYPPQPDPYAPRRSAPPPPPPSVVAPQNRGAGCGMFVLGMFLLGGVLGLIYLFLFTDLPQTISSLFEGGTGNRPRPTAVVGEPTDTPEPTPGETPSPTSEVLVFVPDLVQRTDQEARDLLRAAGLEFSTNPPVNHPQIPQGLVISQDIPAGTQIAEGSVVTYTVSLGPDLVAVPVVTGQQVADARAALEGAGFRVEVREEPNLAAAGEVVSQSPSGGRVERGSTVSLVVSLGDVVRFPDVIGLSRAEAEAIIRATPGLTLEFVDEQGSDRLPNFDSYRPNEVVSAAREVGDGSTTAPVANGAFIPRGSAIILGVRAP